MSRYKYDERTGKVLRWSEKTGKWVKDRKKAKGFDFSRRMNFVPDIQEFMAYAADKPQLITSRSQLGRYERSNGIRQCGDFKRGEIAERRSKKVNRDLAEAKRLGGGVSFTWSDFS